MTKDELIRQIRAAQARGQRAVCATVRAAAIRYATELRAAAINAAAESALNGIVRSGPAAVRELPRYGSVIEVTGSTGFGAHWLQRTGEFTGFINR